MIAPEDLRKAVQAGDWAGYFRQLREAKDEATQAKAEIVAPGPEHTSRDPWPDGFAVPGGAASLVKLAESAGWVTRVQYARGSVVTRRKDQGRIVERRHSVAVALWHPGRNLHAVALWEARVEPEANGKLGWKADVAKVWAAGETPREVGVMALKATVKGEA